MGCDRRCNGLGRGHRHEPIPGIGRKGANGSCLNWPITSDRHRSRWIGGRCSAAVPGWRDDVVSSLVGLGWSPREAKPLVQAVSEQVAPDADVPPSSLRHGS